MEPSQMAEKRTLIVLAHPLGDSYCAALAGVVRDTLSERGHHVDLIDLYADGFDPRLSAAERAAYFEPDYDPAPVADYVRRLGAATHLVFVFPQWWGNCPAILKGFFDRVFVPGVAFDVGASPGQFVPQLTQVDKMWVVMTAGSPWWVTWLYLGHPVRRQMRRAIAGFCGRDLSFRMLTFHDMDRATDKKRRAFLERVAKAFKSF